MKTGDLVTRCESLQDATRKRGMGQSWAMHIAARMLGQVGELLSLAEKVDGTDDAAEIRRLRDLYLEERARADRLSEKLSDRMST